MNTAGADPIIEGNFYKRYKRYYTYLEPIVSDPLIRSYFTIVASLLLVTFFIIFALSPTVNTILGLLRKIEDQQRVIVALDEKINNLIIAQENFAQVEPQLGLLDSALPSKPTPEIMLLSLLNTNSRTGVGMVSLEFDQISLSSESGLLKKQSVEDITSYSKLGIKEIKFVTGLTGDEERVRQWVRQLENSPRLFKVDSFSFSRSQSDPILASSSGLSVNITGSGFYEE